MLFTMRRDVVSYMLLPTHGATLCVNVTFMLCHDVFHSGFGILTMKCDPRWHRTMGQYTTPC